MPETDLIGRLIFFLIVLLFAVSAHEAAHAWMSYKFGDDTARLLGRITLNPVAHTDPIGTLLIPIISFIGASAGVTIPLVGWGKPTPVNPLRWRNKDTANIMVSLAGIMVNTLLAVVAFVILKVLMATGVITPELFVTVLTERGADAAGVPPYIEPITVFLNYMLMMNAALAVFNLMPFPPLDGSKVLYSILPNAGPALDALEQYGYIILMAAVYFGVFRAIFNPVANLIYGLLGVI
jgi:Zn-dependent protease